MGTTTFSGPIKAGTIKETTGTTVGTDMKNTGPRAGGSITAALFLEEFFDKEIKWAHIDIAGTCWTDKNKGINPSGATGFGVKTLVQWIKNK